MTQKVRLIAILAVGCILILITLCLIFSETKTEQQVIDEDLIKRGYTKKDGAWYDKRGVIVPFAGMNIDWTSGDKLLRDSAEKERKDRIQQDERYRRETR